MPANRWHETHESSSTDYNQLICNTQIRFNKNHPSKSLQIGSQNLAAPNIVLTFVSPKGRKSLALTGFIGLTRTETHQICGKSADIPQIFPNFARSKVETKNKIKKIQL